MTVSSVPGKNFVKTAIQAGTGTSFAGRCRFLYVKADAERSKNPGIM